jgi:capsid protein
MAFMDLFRRRSPGGPEAMRARLEGAMAKRRLRGWNPPLENINALVASGGPRLLARARELVVTNGHAANHRQRLQRRRTRNPTTRNARTPPRAQRGFGS